MTRPIPSPVRGPWSGRLRRLGGGLVVLLAGAAALAGPRAVVEQTGLDLGEVPRGTIVEATFEVRNAGDEVLRILRVKPG